MICAEIQEVLTDLERAFAQRDIPRAELIFFPDPGSGWNWRESGHDSHGECILVLSDAESSLQALLEEVGEARSWFLPKDVKKLFSQFTTAEAVRLLALTGRLNSV